MSVRLDDIALRHPELADLDPAARRLALRALVAEKVPDDVGSVVRRLADEIDGFGPLSEVLRDPSVSDILVNGPAEVWLERDGTLDRSDLTFEDADALLRLVDRMLAAAGEHVDATRPVADARLADGSRLHVVLPPVAPAGPLVSIRRFPASRWSLAELVRRSTLTEEQAAKLEVLVGDRRTIVIAGGTGTGKTTLLNALLGAVPPSQRVVTVEETPELRPACAHRVALVARPPNVEQMGGIDMAALLRTALRMRPDRIVVGEVRGPEALVALASMATGHPGSLMTVHAASAPAAVERLVGLALQDAAAPSEDTLRSFVRSAVDVVVQLERGEQGRQVVEILEV